MKTSLFILGFVLAVIGVTLVYAHMPTTSNTKFTLNQSGSLYGEYFTSTPITVPFNGKVTITWSSNVNITVGVVTYQIWQAFNATGDTGNVNGSAYAYGYGISNAITFVSNSSSEYVIYIYAAATSSIISANFGLNIKSYKSLEYIGIPVITGGALAIIYGLITSGDDNKPKDSRDRDTQLHYGNAEKMDINKLDLRPVVNTPYIPVNVPTKTDKKMVYSRDVVRVQPPAHDTPPLITVEKKQRDIVKVHHHTISDVKIVGKICPVCKLKYEATIDICPNCGAKIK
ncbi:MAG: hypothetical protein M1481_05335 [Candidatus Thermoplasmatota archaeon]|nr:hypothetical protein [Candidatus Thermoplasmatota archaeon]MCL5963635.1 hypothetical protein [Candidatus Thermoplasmatota archaeon]